MRFRSDRTLLKALIASFLVHAALLLAVPNVLPPVPEASSTSMTVALRSVGNKAGQSVARRTESNPKEKPAGPLVRPSSVRGKVLSVPDQPASRVAVVSPVDAATELRGSAAAAEPAPATGAVSGDSGNTSATEVGASEPVTQALREEGVNAEDVRQYRTSLAISARRFKRYPALARERGWEGSVEIALYFRRSGPVPEILVAASSGRKILDEQALEMIRQASRTAEMPERLNGRDFRIVLPIIFSLDDER